MGAPVKDVRTLGEKGVSSNEDIGGQREGVGLALSKHSFQCIFLREKRSFKGHFIIIFLC